MSTYVRRIAVLSAAFPDGWSVYPIQATRGDRAGTVASKRASLPAGGAGRASATPGRQEADERASTGG
jgi:hypothetical protein